MARILVADDDALMRELVVAALTEDGHTVIVAKDGDLVMAVVRSEFPDLIVLDVAMPTVDGFEVCRRLKSDARTARIPVILFTGHDHRNDRLRGLQVGADDFVPKPIGDFTDLRQCVRTRLRLRRAA